MGQLLEISFESEVIHWRGPAPFFFIKVPEKEAMLIHEISRQVSYGWGVIPSDVTIKETEFYTALIPKDGTYLLPLRKAVREQLNLDLGDLVKVRIQFLRIHRSRFP